MMRATQFLGTRLRWQRRGGCDGNDSAFTEFSFCAHLRSCDPGSRGWMSHLDPRSDRRNGSRSESRAAGQAQRRDDQGAGSGNHGNQIDPDLQEVCAPEQEGVEAGFRRIRALYRGKQINNPYRTEANRTADGVSVEILFYYTDQRVSDPAITDDELTPLVIEDGVLAGWGWNFLDQNVEKYRIELRSQ